MQPKWPWRSRVHLVLEPPHAHAVRIARPFGEADRRGTGGRMAAGGLRRRHVLVVDDDPSLCAILEAELRQREYGVTVTQSPEDALTRVDATADDDIHVILTDVNMHAISGVELCARVVGSGHDIPVIVMTAFGSMDSAVAAIRAGAYDYITKPLDTNDLVLTLDRALKERELRQEVRRLRLEVNGGNAFEGMVGSSPAMRKTFDLIERVAKTEVTALVMGESGSGKELVAQAIHAPGRRADRPVVALNCAAMPESLLESELFGHTNGTLPDA